jgi:DNA polymerase I
MQDVIINLVESWDEAQSFMHWLGERRPILACDTETGGFDWWVDKLRLVQFGDAYTGWVIPWEMWGGLAKEALERYDDNIAWHNAKFDIKFLEYHGVKVKRHLMQDTRTMAHLLDPASPTGLKELGVCYVDASCDQGQATLKKGMLQNKWTWANVPVNFTPYWIYSGLDPVITARLYEQFEPQITGPLEDLYEMEIAVIWILNEIEKKGARVDVDYCISKRDELRKSADEQDKWIFEEFGVHAGQNAKLVDVFRREGVKLTKKTGKTKSYSMDEDVLKSIDHELAHAVLDVRKARKYAKAYFSSYIERAVDGFIHPDINPLGARTGRMSVSKPPLQQIPRTKLTRSPFIPREGHKLVSVDFDQIEMRIFAHLSGDPSLVEAFHGENDFFCALAEQIYGRPIDKVKDKKIRTVTKNTCYGIVYGAGIAKSASMTGIPFEEMQQFRKQFDTRFPGIKVHAKSVEQEARMNEKKTGVPFVTTPMGRIQPADFFNEQWKLYALVNYQIQGCAADMFKQTLVELDQADLTQFLILPVHDEVVADVPKDDADEVAHEMVECFEANQPLKVPVTADSNIVDCWGDAYND